MFESGLWGETEVATAAGRAALPVPYNCVCSIFVHPNHSMSASVWDSNVRTDADARDCSGGLYEYRKESLR